MANGKSKAAETEVVTAPSSTAIAAYGEYDDADAGAGFEGTDRNSFAIPFLTVLQKGSPQVDEASTARIEGAEAGMFYSSVTGRLYDGKNVGVRLLFAAYQQRYIRWGARGTDGAGFRGEVRADEVQAMIGSGAVVELDGRLLVPLADGTVNEKRCERLADVRNHFCVMLHDDDTFEAVLLSLTSTQIKKSRAIMSALNNLRVRTVSGRIVQPATYDSVIRVTTVLEKNDKGSWYGIKPDLSNIVPAGRDSMARAAAKDLSLAVNKGDAAAKYEDAPTQQEMSGF
jgi:hypothetical protein